MLTLLLVLAAAPQGASVGAGPEPWPLDRFERVRALCEALRGQQAQDALERDYRIDVPSKGFALGRYRPEERELELDGDRPVRAADGTLLVDLRGIDEVAFHAGPEQVAQWKKLKEAGELTLSVVLRASPDGCAGSAHAGQLRLGGNAQSWRLLGPKGALLAAADEEGKPLSRLQGAPQARVRTVAFDAEKPAPDDGRSRLESAQPALDACARAAKKPGSLVVSFDSRGGTLHDVQVVVDSLRDEEVSSCIAKALTGAPLQGAGHGTATIAVE
jgi:hypothetical protein